MLTQVKCPSNRSVPFPSEEPISKPSQGAADQIQGITAIPDPDRQPPSSADSAVERKPGEEEPYNIDVDKIDPIDYWRREGNWPKEYFVQDYQITKEPKRDSWAEAHRYDPWVQEMFGPILARPKASSRGSGSTTSSPTTPSDQKPSEVKSARYRDARYKTLLATKGIFMKVCEEGMTKESESECRTFLHMEQPIPRDSLFDDHLFESTCEMMLDKNEARVVRDIAQLIVPSAEVLALRGDNRLKILIESVNEGWDNSVPITQPRPQPDYSVGFRREAFTDEQLDQLRPFIGELTEASLFMATFYLYFPFLTCEAKCGAADLEVGDKQNAHSATMAVRGVVELFRLVGREKELDRQPLAFSISHDHINVRIYGHYPVIRNNKTLFYRQPIRLMELNGETKWTAYRFTRNIYERWAPTQFARLCSVVDQLPSNLNFAVSEQSELRFPDAGLARQLEGPVLSSPSRGDSAPLRKEHDGQSGIAASHHSSPNTSLSQGIEAETFRMPKKRRASGEQRGAK
ncbi:MAG: hypothetical protein M1817_003863 [Caeruleum heppii]|nr:MAG: hypothetical protein M1817_003863 [Caeruleum heppii]